MVLCDLEAHTSPVLTRRSSPRTGPCRQRQQQPLWMELLLIDRVDGILHETPASLEMTGIPNTTEYIRFPPRPKAGALTQVKPFFQPMREPSL